ncbi:DUF3604 domain-containing protein [Nonomuraea polychroma]|uniref:DUF3604 domain-containing protein n=1 Tax=Nonomuraea polychroma TaxID=46176 RepID=UPI000FDEB004|nr:DUF3604 domain-containing protein [Nonomuraea polychroma]
MGGQHGGHGGHSCCGVDHHTGEYTEGQRAELERVLTFNRRMAAAIEDCLDVSGVEALLDPDPLRYMWVDEGGGRLTEFLEGAEAALSSAPRLDGHRRSAGTSVRASGTATRPSVATTPDGRVLHAWIEWEKDTGDRVMALLLDGLLEGAQAVGDPIVLSGEPADCFRPTALFDADGRPWVFYARAHEGEVSVFCRRGEQGGWTREELVSTTGHPSFNQEAIAHVDGGVEVCWQGPLGKRFGIYARRWRDGAWSEPHLVSERSERTNGHSSDFAHGASEGGAVSSGAEGNVWDPAVAAAPGGGSIYAWCEYRQGAYRIVVRRADPAGALADPRPVTSGSDYALHPSLAVTADGAVWCGFDVITVAGHGGSGPTRLRPADRLSDAPRVLGMRESGEFIPPELLPEISASIRVVRLDNDGLYEPEGRLAPSLDVVPSGLPRLVADPAGGLTVAYRIHRRLPLMTYYWEVATQTLGPDGWSAPTTLAASDGTLEEPALAPLPSGALVAWQTDDRLERALAWTEGFGGRECPFLLEHHGEVIWHGMHGTGAIRSATLTAAGRAIATRRLEVVHSDERREARGWADADRTRYRTTVDGKDYALYWGDLHRHSLISRCTSGDEPSLEDFYRYSWDVCEYDFWAVTDHSENSTDYQWWSIQKMADLFRVDGRFVPLYGFEWTGLMGHQNVIYGDVRRGAPIFSAYAKGSETPAGLWDGLRRHPEFPAITIPHHPGSAMVPFDWDYHDPQFLRVVEVFQACRGNYEDDGCFRQYADGTLPGTFVLDGLRRGQRFGLIASSDHGHGASYVGAYAERLDRAAVFDALYQRRVFAATQRGIVVDARIGDVFMGGEAERGAPVDLDVYARGYGDLARIEVVRNGEVVHTVLPDLGLPPHSIAVPVRVEWGMSPVPTDWSGSVSILGGEVLRTPYWSPEITEVDRQRVCWVNTTKSFGEPYGAQRGGVEFTLIGPPAATVVVKTSQGEVTTTLGALDGNVVEVPVKGPGRLRLQPGVGGLTALGGRERRVRWTDVTHQHLPGAPDWYYVRVYQTDGEMAWSSPIWIGTPVEERSQ